jgi:type IV pilus assembly protein PilQ
MAANRGRFHVASALALAALTWGVYACAGSGTGSGDASAPEASAQEQVQNVEVESEAGLSRVTLVGLQNPVFTAFQQSDPDRLIVDLSGVTWNASTDPVSVDDGNLVQVTVAPFATGSEEPMTRVELSLVSAADYDVRPGPRGLVIEVSPLAEMGSLEEPHGDAMASDEDPWAGAADGESSDFESLPADGEEAAPMTTVGTRLERVEATPAGAGVVIHLVANGSVENASSFTLEGPPRLVVDLVGLKSTAREKNEVGAGGVQRVRVGNHADKVRVVIDGAPEGDPFDGRRVLPVATGLLIALGEGEEVEAAVAKASAQAPSGAPAAQDVAELDTDTAGVPADAADAMDTTPSGVATIDGVEFEPQVDHDRVVIRSAQPIDYLVYEPDPETVVLSISGATLAPEGEVRIAPEAAGPVSLVTAFEQPDVRTPEVRVVMKRASGLKPSVTREGTTLLVDFPHTGEAAARPPVLAMGAQAPGSELSPAPGLASMDTAVGTLATSGSAPGTAMPASIAPGLPGAAHSGGPVPAGIDSPAWIDILEEGGLMDGKEYVGRRISLDFKEVEIADVLRLIAEVSDLNVIAGDEVKGAVTIRLVDVPWDQALDVILLTKGLGFARIGNVLRVASNEVLAQEEELRLQERRAKEKLEDLVVKLQPVNYASVDEVAGMISKLLTSRGSVNKDKRTNTLIIKDIASVIDEATALVKAVDTITPQVMIESKIVEANLDFSREFGAVWNFGTNPLTESTLGGRDYIFTPGASEIGNSVAFPNGITALPTGLVNLAATVIDEKFNYELQLQAAESNGDGKVISSPRVVTLDNSEAEIQQGVSIPFQTFENGDAQLEFIDAVLQLKVTPHITSDQSIVMEIAVSRNAPDDSVFTETGSPAIAKNQVKTETLVKDGQTLVLGGIYVVDKAERQSRTPYLHAIPFLGNLFKSNEYNDSRKELLIFVTPRIVRQPTVAS